MKLIKQSRLFFKEGNSDKVYEIDLCEISGNQYVVNFRFGKRSSVLKEGTKTTSPISLASAEQVFDSLEAEKRRKGYQSEEEMFQPLPEISILNSANLSDSAILKRLKATLDGTKVFKTEWQISRVIWRAGELKLQEAVSFIIRLTDRGDEMQRYAALWALGRIGDASAERTLRVYYSNQKYSDKTRRIAGEGLLQILRGEAKAEHLKRYIERLPETVKKQLQKPNDLALTLNNLVFESQSSDYDFLIDLYTISIDNQDIKKSLITVLRKIPFKAIYFRPVRHILKIAELRDDFEVLGLLSYRFERTLEMFKMPVGYYDVDENREFSVYISAINQSLKVKSELKKKNSKLAYSDRTRAYLIRKTLRQLKELGANQQPEYVKLALSILLSYDSVIDYKNSYSTTEYKYGNNYSTWEHIRKTYPVYSDAVLMNLILYGAGDRLKFTGKVWVNNEVEVLNRSSNQNNNWNRYTPTPNTTAPPLSAQNQEEGGILNRVFDSIFSLFSSTKNNNEIIIEPSTNIEHTEPEKVSNAAELPVQVTEKDNTREELFPELWDKVPQAYIQILLKARVGLIHDFAIKNLQKHPDFEQIKTKIDFSLIEQLLASKYQVPALFALNLVKEKLQQSPDRSLILALLNSPLIDARSLGLKFIEEELGSYFEESAFLSNLLFSPYDDVRVWLKKVLYNNPVNEVQQQLLVGRSIVQLAKLNDNNYENNAVIKDATNIILLHCSDALSTINNQLIIDLLTSSIEATQVFAVKIIILKNIQPSAEALCRLLSSSFVEVRKAGSELLTELKPKTEADSEYATLLVNYLVPLLMRKEPYEGLHQDISEILSNQLVEHLHTVNATTTIRLIHSNYRPAQDFGFVLLTKYIDPKQLSIRQIIDLANHEQIAYRQWTWNYYTQNIARIKFERDEAIRLLDAKWDDSRAFAINYFREKFDADDWSPEVLVSIADSVRPDIETFGRELISRFFEEGQGEEYLLKLSQHPSIGVQLFATNYLERFASNNTEKLKNLDFYFRSALTKVNKGRNSKSRIFSFLHQEALKSADSAVIVANILRDVSATVSIEDKATCIGIMQNLQKQFGDLNLPIKIIDFETR
ncbi:hypothetical protein GCM10027035_46910 [Emticicia sediminis]